MSKEFDRTRPEVQAEDIGPVVNHLTKQLYGQVGEQWYPQEEYPFYGVAKTIASELIIQAEQKYHAWEAAGFYESESRAMMNVKGGPMTITASRAITEGLRSGIVIPIKALHKKLRMDRERSAVEYEWLDTIDHRVITGFLRSKRFQAELLRLSHAPNNAYGASSAQVSPNSLFQKYYEPGYEDGSLNPAVLDKIDKKLHMANSGQSHESPPTMGCPVRMATYRRLGPIALTYAREFDVDHEVLLRSGESAIVTGCELVADCFDRYYEVFPGRAKTTIPPIIRELVRTSLPEAYQDHIDQNEYDVA